MLIVKLLKHCFFLANNNWLARCEQRDFSRFPRFSERWEVFPAFSLLSYPTGFPLVFSEFVGSFSRLFLT